MYASTPIWDHVRLSLTYPALSEADKSKKNQYPKHWPRDNQSALPICNHTKWKKICANPNNFSSCFGQPRCAKEKDRTESWNCCINQQSLCKEGEGNGCKKERKKTRFEKVWNTSVQKVTVMLRWQCSKEAIEGTEDSPCLYYNDPFSISKPGESWIQYAECKLWAHCEQEVQKEGKYLSVICANEKGKPRGRHHVYCVMTCRPKIPLLKILLLQYQ